MVLDLSCSRPGSFPPCSAQTHPPDVLEALQQGIFFLLFIYVFFNLLWGLNYNRKGIADQLSLEVKPFACRIWIH
jgi:hypothetical protein